MPLICDKKELAIMKSIRGVWPTRGEGGNNPWGALDAGEKTSRGEGQIRRARVLVGPLREKKCRVTGPGRDTEATKKAQTGGGMRPAGRGAYGSVQKRTASRQKEEGYNGGLRLG